MKRSSTSMSDSGHITVETVGTFVPLVLLIISILSLVNIVTVQARVHYALTQTAITLSIYSYALEAAGLSGQGTGASSQQSGTSGFNIADIDSIFSGIGDMIGSGISDNLNKTGIMGDIVNSVKDSASNPVLNTMIKPLVVSNLANGDLSGEEYLLQFGIKNMNLKTVELPNVSGNVKLTLQYEVDYLFGALPLPFGPTLKITQTAITKGWQNGSGEGYW